MSPISIFILDGEEVSGPYSESEVFSILSENRYKNPLIWWRGLSEWLPPNHWEKRLGEVKRKSLQKAERLWKVRTGDAEPATMSQKQMLHYLAEIKDLSKTQLWTEGYEDWKEVYQIHPIMDELGVSRRKHPRVPLSGTVNVVAGSNKFEAQAKTISEGGLGLTGASGLKIGERVSLMIRSPQLYLTIHTAAEVVYLASGGIAGLRFETLSSENKSAIIEYTKKFEQSKA